MQEDAEDQYYVDVPAGATSLTVQISGGTGDADLYVRFGSEPTTSVSDCRPFLGGNNETCQFDNPSQGRWYVMVRAYNAYSGALLSATVDTASNPPTDQIVDACLQGQTVVGNVQLFAETAVCLQDVGNGGQRQMHFFVEADKVGRTLEIILSHGSGNGTLLHKHGGRPNGAIFDYISNNAGNEEKIVVQNVQAQWNYIHVQGDPTFSGATLLVRYQ